MVIACDDPTKPNLTPEYTVNFFANGGSPAPQSQTIRQGDKIIEPAAMTKDGYSFAGWYTEAAFTNQWNFATNAVTDNTTLYAKWDNYDTNYTISFNADGGNPAPAQQDIAHSGKVAEPPYMTKAGFGFAGWYKEADFINLWNFATDTVTGNITLYAKWDSNYSTVTFNANGGSPAPGQQNIAHGSKAIKPPDLSKAGYTFGGWYKDENCINLWNFNTDTVTGNITLYAKWIENFTVTFNANGGTPAPAQQDIPLGGKITEPPYMTRTGYGFAGWYKEENCINLWDLNTDTVTSSITLYAKWDTNYYTVSFNANGGSPAPTQQNIVHGGKAVMPPTMTRTGYSFAGWYKEENCINLWNFNSDTVTGNITLYAKWDNNYYTVSFVTNGGSPAPAQQDIAYASKVSEPAYMSKTGFGFGGWYKEENCINLWNFNSDTVTGNITLYAKWEPLLSASGTTLIEKLQWLDSNAVSNTSYALEVNATEYLNAWTLSYSGKSNVTIRLIGIGSTRNVELYGSGSLFTVGNGVTLVLDENINLKGTTSNNASLVRVNDGGNLIMNNGSKITGNRSSSSNAYGGGVYVSGSSSSPGTFTMNGGEISGNTASASNSSSSNAYGGGVYVVGGTFIMTGGEISGNTASGNTANSNYYESYGGGVYISNGTFTMNNGTISGNTASGNTASYGGGVYVSNGTFTMNGGEISGNTASSNSSSYGGGVYISNGTFTMSNGTISGNTASASNSSNSNGGGVYVSGNYDYNTGTYVGGTFTMNGGTISGNTASYQGGGVYVSDGTFTMTGGTISGNTASYQGGGVYIDRGTFTMNGGTISGNTASSYGGGGVYIDRGTFTMTGGEISGNTVSSGGGGGVYIGNSSRFEKTGGIITGYSSDTINGNVVKSGNSVQNNRGHAVYVAHNDSRFIRRKETTSGQGDNLSYIINEPYPPTITGAWDE